MSPTASQRSFRNLWIAAQYGAHGTEIFEFADEWPLLLHTLSLARSMAAHALPRTSLSDRWTGG
jgi:hypothetical protein